MDLFLLICKQHSSLIDFRKQRILDWLEYEKILFCMFHRRNQRKMKRPDHSSGHSSEPKAKYLVDRDSQKLLSRNRPNFSHFSITIVRGPSTSSLLWNLHTDAHDRGSHGCEISMLILTTAPVISLSGMKSTR